MKRIETYIQVDDLHKSYGKKEVLKGISLSIDRDSFWGVFGKNGAGKTTLFKTLLGLIPPTSGNIYLDGVPSKKANHLSIGYLPENIALYGHLSAADNLRIAALSAGGDLSKKQTEDILNTVNLSSGSTLAKELSLGMKRRLQFAMAALTKPADLLVLDEPTNGMDVNGVLWLKDYFTKLKNEGVTILVCSHSLNIMEEIIDHYCMIREGKIIKSGKWDAGDSSQYLITYGNISDHDIDRMAEIGSARKIDEHTLSLSSKKRLYEIVRFLIDQKIEIEDIKPVKDSLEKIFIESVTGNVSSDKSGMD